MCGKLCAVRTMNRVLNGEKVELKKNDYNKSKDCNKSKI